MRPIVILAAAALVGLLAASSTSKGYALGYTFTDLNVPGSQPGSTGAFDGLAINNLGQIGGSYIDSSGNFDGSLYMGGKYVTADAADAIDTGIYGINDPGQVVGTASYSNGSSYNLIATIAILLLLLIAAGSSFAGSNARAVLVWNGDWVRSNREDGKGLAAVREAIMWEIAFAPPACRAEPVRGLVLLSVSTAPGSVRLAIGSAEWRWSDLLTPSHSLSGVAGVAATG